MCTTSFGSTSPDGGGLVDAVVVDARNRGEDRQAERPRQAIDRAEGRVAELVEADRQARRAAGPRRDPPGAGCAGRARTGTLGTLTGTQHLEALALLGLLEIAGQRRLVLLGEQAAVRGHQVVVVARERELLLLALRRLLDARLELRRSRRGSAPPGGAGRRARAPRPHASRSSAASAGSRRREVRARACRGVRSCAAPLRASRPPRAAGARSDARRCRRAAPAAAPGAPR